MRVERGIGGRAQRTGTTKTTREGTSRQKNEIIKKRKERKSSRNVDVGGPVLRIIARQLTWMRVRFGDMRDLIFGCGKGS